MGTVKPVCKLKTTSRFCRREISTACKSQNLKSKTPLSHKETPVLLFKKAINPSITHTKVQNISTIMSTKRKIEDEETEATKKAKPTYDDEEEEEDEVEAEGEEEDGEEEEDLEGEEDEEGGEEEDDEAEEDDE